MAELPFMHVGIVVRDLDQAIAAFGAKLGIVFADQMETPLHLTTEAGPVDVTPRLTYSKVGPPWIELIQVQDSDEGLFGRNNLGFHHIGMWSPSCSEDMAHLKSHGVDIEAHQQIPTGQSVMALIEPAGLEGVRFELIDAMARPTMEQWLSS